jgi:Domain of unknown function (DUF5050)
MGQQIGDFYCQSTPCVDGEYIYFQDLQNNLRKVNIDNPDPNSPSLGQTISTPSIDGEGFIYFQDPNNNLIKVEIAQPSNQTNLGSIKTNIAPCVPGDGYIYFQAQLGNPPGYFLARMALDGTQFRSYYPYQAATPPCVPGDGCIYFQGTDNPSTLWQMSVDYVAGDPLGEGVGDMGCKTQVPPAVPGDTYLYFQGMTDSRSSGLYLGRGVLPLPGKALSGFETFWPMQAAANAPLAVDLSLAPGYLYFQGTDGKLWQQPNTPSPCSDEPPPPTPVTSAVNIGSYLADSAPCAPGDGFIYFEQSGVYYVDKTLIRQAVAGTYDPANWMRDLMSNGSLGNSTLGEITIPGSHDSGMYQTSDPTGSLNSKTQDRTVGEQLNGGVRYFDLRPCIPAFDDQFYIYHGVLLGKVLAWGPPLSDVLSDINGFMSGPNRQEMVILKFGGFEGVDAPQFSQFLSQVQQYLSDWLYIMPEGAKRLADTKLSALQGKVIVVCEYGNIPATPGIYVYRNGAGCPYGKALTNDPTPGDLRVYDCWSNMDVYGDMLADQKKKFANYDGNCDPNFDKVPCDLYLLSWTLTPSYPTSVASLTATCNPELAAASQNFAPHDGVRVNIIYVDYFETADVLSLCIQANIGTPS